MFKTSVLSTFVGICNPLLRGCAIQFCGGKKYWHPRSLLQSLDKVQITYRQVQRVIMCLGYQNMGKRGALQYGSPGNGNLYLPVYHLLDAALSYRNEKFNITLNVYNITNIKYATMGSFNASTNEWHYTPGEPTNFRLSFGVNFRSGKRNL